MENYLKCNNMKESLRTEDTEEMCDKCFVTDKDKTWQTKATVEFNNTINPLQVSWCALRDIFLVFFFVE